MLVRHPRITPFPTPFYLLLVLSFLPPACLAASRQSEVPSRDFPSWLAGWIAELNQCRGPSDRRARNANRRSFDSAGRPGRIGSSPPLVREWKVSFRKEGRAMETNSLRALRFIGLRGTGSRTASTGKKRERREKEIERRFVLSDLHGALHHRLGRSPRTFLRAEYLGDSYNYSSSAFGNTEGVRRRPAMSSV